MGTKVAHELYSMIHSLLSKAVRRKNRIRMETKRTIFVSDVHGCLVELKQLQAKLNYNPDEDRMILLGDLIDRGPDSAGVVRYARETKLECIMGNHEHKFIKWFRSQGTRVDVYDKRAFYADLSD